MWSLPSRLLSRIYNGVTIVLAIPALYVFLTMILNDGANDSLNGAGALVGAFWMVIPLGCLFMVALANLPSTTDRVRAILSVASLLIVLFLAAVPLGLIFWV